MKMFHKNKWNCITKWLMITAVFIMSLFMVPGFVSAGLPWLDVTGSFTYDYSHRSKGQTYFDYTLTFTSWNITGGQYADSSYFGENVDPITDAWIEINGSQPGPLYNDASPNNLDFGTATFTIKDASTTFLSATLDNFIVDDGMFWGTPFTELNKYQDDDNITNVTYGTNTGSDYIDDLSATTAPFNLSWAFTFNAGMTYGDGTAFTEDSSGSFSGKMYAGPAAVVPEPISSILFITGGATLAIRRYHRRKKASK